MPGKHPLLNNLIFLLLALGLGTGSALAATPSDPIAILLSDSDEVYQKQATAFSEEIELKTEIFNLQGDEDRDPGLKDKILSTKPVLIYALGAKAAYAAKLWTQNHQEIPVLFAMVINWQRYNLLEGSSNMAGIAAEMAPGTQFANMTMFSPTVKRVGLLYSSYSSALLVQARKEAALLGLELVAEPLEHSEDFQRSFKKISGHIDAFWVLNDPVLYTLENLDWLEGRCLKEKLFCVGQSKNLAKLGLTLTVNPEMTQISIQAAAIAKNILLRGQKPNEIRVMEPIGTQLLVNSKTATRIGLILSPQALKMATSVIDR
ncbi:MAG: ABC transporter substrate binding protein [Desulfobulbaceae bacterium]|nr:ABC transporter substrate binding protein [Desulfobulbaceae bacterium]